MTCTHANLPGPADCCGCCCCTTGFVLIVCPAAVRVVGMRRVRCAGVFLPAGTLLCLSCYAMYLCVFCLCWEGRVRVECKPLL